MEEAAKVLEKNKDLKRAATLRKQLGDINMCDSNSIAAMKAYQDALDLLKQNHSEKSHYAAEVLFAMGDLKSGQKDNEAALALVEKGCALMEKGNDSNNDPHTLAIGLHKLAFIYGEMNRDDDAIAADEKAKAIEMGGINTSIGKLPKL